MIVLISVTSTTGIFSALNVKVTLVIAEVIPFLVLAVGVDNIFLLSSEMERQTSLALASGANERRNRTLLGESEGGEGFAESDNLEEDSEQSETEETGPFGSYGGQNRNFRNLSSNSICQISSSERASRALSKIGPSILLSSTIQVSCFLLGALVPMPAVRNFALYAAGSMALTAIFQCTIFIVVMAKDTDRKEDGRIDCWPCFKIRKGIRLVGDEGERDDHEREYSTSSSNVGNGIESSDALMNEGVLSRFIRRHYSPFLLKPAVKKSVLVIFSGLFVASLIGSRKVKMGLDQRLALPSNSYLRDYFDSLDTFLDVGPPFISLP